MKSPRVSRRTTLRWMGIIATALSAGSLRAGGKPYFRSDNHPGYGPDPDMVNPVRNVWATNLSDAHREAIAVLVDVLLPGDATLKPASQIGVVELFEEWLSAPYPLFVADREMILPLLDQISPTQPASSLTVQSIATHPAFERFRQLAAAAYYTTDVGMQAIGFVGNQPRTSFDGPPAEVLAHFEAEYRKL